MTDSLTDLRSWARPGRDPRIAALAIVAGVTLLRVAALFLSSLELYGDESQYWTYAEEPGFGYYSKPPMIAWLIDATTMVVGATEAGVRLSSPLLHGVTAMVLFAAASAMFNGRTGFWAAVAYVTLPGVSFSSMLASTDVPLLACWSVALLAVWRLRDGGGIGWVVTLGVAFGLGLHSKYAMAYFLLCLAVAAVFDRPLRGLLAGPRLWSAIAVGLLVWSPNLWWNLQHEGATIAHIGENANVDAEMWKPGETLEFIGAQFGVMGPVLFGAFLLRLIRLRRRPATGPEPLLLAFSVPVLAAITLQALLFGANANWAVTAYPAATILVVGSLLGRDRRRWLTLSTGMHGAVLGLMLLYAVSPAVQALPGLRDATARLDGWRKFGVTVSVRAAESDADTVLLDHRFLLAQLWFYGDVPPQKLRIWVNNTVSNHYEMTRAFDPEAPHGRVLYISRWDDAAPVRLLGPPVSHETFTVDTIDGGSRLYHLFVFPERRP